MGPLKVDSSPSIPHTYESDDWDLRPALLASTHGNCLKASDYLQISIASPRPVPDHKNTCMDKV